MISPIIGLLALFSLTNASVIPNQAILHPSDPVTLSRPSWFTSTLLARRLLAKSPSGVISTIFPTESSSSSTPNTVAGLPIGLREYISDCDAALPKNLNPTNKEEGNPTILALRVATSFKNIGSNSNFSLELDWWDHLDQAGPVYPGLPLSSAALPRVTLFGYLDPLHSESGSGEGEGEGQALGDLEECFLSSHPDAKVWLPGKAGSPHSSFWARMVVTHVYWIGGFGDVQQIGWIDLNEWKGIGRYRSEVGDGRGWEDVRLPGEEE
ncbi:hypothetical protein N7490_008064 [Penicillium lividum]|nr:hypothetical protein N7490_008064 [Penicillium lividum]